MCFVGLEGFECRENRGADDNIWNVTLDSERAGQILDYLQTYEYALRPNVALKLMWHTMMWIGAVHALDCADSILRISHSK